MVQVAAPGEVIINWENSSKSSSFVRSSASTNHRACRSSHAAGLSCSGEALVTLPGSAMQ